MYDLIPVLMTIIIALGAAVIVQQARIVHLRRRYETQMAGELEKARTALVTGNADRTDAEWVALQERVQVLERIATDPGKRLEQDIDALRHSA